jgi:hypothetical protein
LRFHPFEHRGIGRQDHRRQVIDGVDAVEDARQGGGVFDVPLPDVAADTVQAVNAGVAPA